MKSIGGYFELELAKKGEYHHSAIKLNTGRNALEYILSTEKIETLYVPKFICSSILEPVKKLNQVVVYYDIDKNFSPIVDLTNWNSNDGLLYVNYFGLNDHISLRLADKDVNLIIDNSQSFFSKPIQDTLTFYSPRKFFGIPDGGYLYSNKILELSQDTSLERFEALLGRIDTSAEEYFVKYKEMNNALSGQPIRRMSKITERILSSIDYSEIARIRRANFQLLDSAFGSKNGLQFKLFEDTVPLGYPLLIENGNELKSFLIRNKVYVPTYWSNVLNRTQAYSLESILVRDLVFLPIDQRYGIEEMTFIIELIDGYLH